MLDVLSNFELGILCLRGHKKKKVKFCKTLAVNIFYTVHFVIEYV